MLAQSERRKRNSNIEFLRISAMFFIILHHFSVHGLNHSSKGWSFLNGSVIHKSIIELLSFGGKPAVCIFVIISGYFMVTSNMKIQKVLGLWIEVITYSIMIYIVLLMTHSISFMPIAFIKSILPITFNQYWFLTNYIILYIFTPYVNRLIRQLSFYQLLTLVSLWTVPLVIVPTFTGQTIDKTNILGFFYLYCIGAFIRLYQRYIKLKSIGWTFSILGFVSMLASVICLNYLSSITGKVFFASQATHFLEENSLLTILFSVGVFLIVLSMESRENSVINYISGSVFAIYLIHDNNNFRTILWHRLLHVHEYPTLWGTVLYGVLICLGIFIVCEFIDILRREIFVRFIDVDKLIRLFKKVPYRKIAYPIKKIFFKGI